MVTNFLQPTFSTRPFDEEVRRRRQLGAEAAMSQIGRAPGDIPVRSTGAGFRGVDLARVGAQQLDRNIAGARVGLLADLEAMQRRRQMLAEEAQRRDRLRAQRMQATARAIGSGTQYANALLQKNLAPLTDRFLSGLGYGGGGEGMDPRLGETDLVSPNRQVVLPGGGTAAFGDIA